jgi:hypothetical protein
MGRSLEPEGHHRAIGGRAWSSHHPCQSEAVRQAQPHERRNRQARVSASHRRERASSRRLCETSAVFRSADVGLSCSRPPSPSAATAQHRERRSRDRARDLDTLGATGGVRGCRAQRFCPRREDRDGSSTVTWKWNAHTYLIRALRRRLKSVLLCVRLGATLPDRARAALLSMWK